MPIASSPPHATSSYHPCKITYVPRQDADREATISTNVVPHAASQTNDDPSQSSPSSIDIQVRLPLPAPISQHPMKTRSKSGIYKPRIHTTELTSPPDDVKPSSPTQALLSPTWKKAMDEEFQTLMKNETWSLVPPPPNQKLVGNKWIFKLKRNPDGTIQRHKARLVAKGFHQQVGVDFFETFNPVIKPSTVRVVLSLAVSNQWDI